MSKILCVTNRHLCQRDFLKQLTLVAEQCPAAIILREKDLTPVDYQSLAQQVMALCEAYGVQCILHSFVDVALTLKADAIHLPLSVLRNMTASEKNGFKILGASCHSLEEALEAQSLGCAYITIGHIFATDCKKGVPGRGVELLRQTCTVLYIPVYAIGGITPDNMSQILEAGAAGGCMMSWWMRLEGVKKESWKK